MEPIRIDPDALYTRAALAEMLEPTGIGLQTFLERTKPRKVFKRAWLGSDILEAYRGAPSLTDGVKTQKSKRSRGQRGKRRASPMLTNEDIGVDGA